MTVKIKVKDKLENNTLDLSCCDLEDVPVKEIAAMKKGTHLDLSNNQLVRLPELFVTLSHIVKLDLSKNLLEELPENIGDLRQLKHLDLYSNKISRLPLSFAELKNLKWLDLKDNPLTNVLSVLAGPCGDNEQCQNCASLVVSYYNTVKQSIAEKKELAMKAAAAEERKKEAKRKRKKKRNAERNANNVAVEEKEKDAGADPDSEIVNENDKTNNGDDENDGEMKSVPKQNIYRETIDNNGIEDGSCNKLCRTFVRRTLDAVFWFSCIALLAIFTLAILPKIDADRSDLLVRYVSTSTGLPIGDYQQQCIRKFDLLADYVGIFVDYVRTLVVDTYERRFGDDLVDIVDGDL